MKVSQNQCSYSLAKITVGVGGGNTVFYRGISF